jgi:hypothetical protein
MVVPVMSLMPSMSTLMKTFLLIDQLSAVRRLRVAWRSR